MRPARFDWPRALFSQMYLNNFMYSTYYKNPQDRIPELIQEI